MNLFLVHIIYNAINKKLKHIYSLGIMINKNYILIIKTI